MCRMEKELRNVEDLTEVKLKNENAKTVSSDRKIKLITNGLRTFLCKISVKGDRRLNISPYPSPSMRKNYKDC